MTDRIARASFLALLVFALVEVGTHAATRARVPKPEDWRRAAEFVRQGIVPPELVTVAPAWADPLLRRVLGDQIDLAMAGRSDTAGYRGLWALVLRDAEVLEAPARPPELERRFGRITVKRWSLGKPSVRYDLVEHVHEAEVHWQRRDGARECAWRRFPPARRAGLGVGVLYPTERFACDAGESWLWVAPVVLEDLELRPRRCVWQHPAGGDDPIVVRYRDVPLGDRLVFYGGLYYEHERMREGGRVRARIRIDDRVAGTFTHDDGDGWKKLVVPTGASGDVHGDLAIEVTAERPDRRSFCWAATTRAGPDAGAP